MSDQQRLIRIHFDKLKCLKNLTFNLGEKNVTGIFGPNGCGKSTILHVLLCLYKPKSDRKNYRFSEFFISVDDKKWIGSKFSYTGTYSESGNTKTFVRKIHKRTDRWMHDYGDRPDRDVFFIGVDSCVPDVEKEKSEIVHLTHGTQDIDKANEIIRIASDVMNFSYSGLDIRKSNKRNYINYKRDGVDYISLSMGAGEQRLFKILSVVLNAPKYSLIIIDELDLTLHTRALERLVNHLVRIANLQHIQIVFTSHRQELAKREDINVRHILPSINGSDSFCFEHTTSECIERLTGRIERPIEIFVEDDVSKAIIEHLVSEVQLKSRTSIICFGDASNAFKAIAGLKIARRLSDSIIAVTDGDVYRTSDDRRGIMKKVISGTENDIEQIREDILNHILQLNPQNGCSPDEYIHESLCESTEDNEIIYLAKTIVGVYDKHQYINELCTKLGGSREVELSRIMQEFAKNRIKWDEYTKPVRDWLESCKMRFGYE